MRTTRIVVILLIGVTLAQGFRSSFAQEAAEPAPEGVTVETTSEEVGQSTTLWGLVRQGGWCMFPLGLLSIAGIGLTIPLKWGQV